MGRVAGGAAGLLGRKIAEIVSRARDERGLDHRSVYTAAGMSESYYYVRMRGDSSFTLNDVERLADALDMHWFELFRLAARDSALADSAIEATIATDPAELSRRIQRLLGALRSDGSPFEWSALQELAETADVPLTQEQFEQISSGEGGVRVRQRVLELLTQFWDVPDGYLVDFEDPDAFDMTDAIVEFRQAMKETGATSIATRSLGDISAAALRAITRTLRSVS